MKGWCEMMEGSKAIEGVLKRMANRPSNDLPVESYQMSSKGEKLNAGWDNDWENDSEWNDAGVWGQQD